MKKEINGKLCELVEQTEDGLCTGCIAQNDDELCDSDATGDECTENENLYKVWKEVRNDD